jgi:asparagine N-glycosylation enzyme membrane subunit Stt3
MISFITQWKHLIIAINMIVLYASVRYIRSRVVSESNTDPSFVYVVIFVALVLAIIGTVVDIVGTMLGYWR